MNNTHNLCLQETPRTPADGPTEVLVVSGGGDTEIPIEPSPVSRAEFEELRAALLSHENSTDNPHQTLWSQTGAAHGREMQDISRRLTINDRADVKRTVLLVLSLILNVVCLIKAF